MPDCKKIPNNPALTGATAYLEAYVMGAGSHNRLGIFTYKYQCTIGYEDALKSAAEYFGF